MPNGCRQAFSATISQHFILLLTVKNTDAGEGLLLNVKLRELPEWRRFSEVPRGRGGVDYCSNEFLWAVY